jgi:hypothetical protein
VVAHGLRRGRARALAAAGGGLTRGLSQRGPAQESRTRGESGDGSPAIHVLGPPARMPRLDRGRRRSKSVGARHMPRYAPKRCPAGARGSARRADPGALHDHRHPVAQPPACHARVAC